MVVRNAVTPHEIISEEVAESSDSDERDTTIRGTPTRTYRPILNAVQMAFSHTKRIK